MKFAYCALKLSKSLYDRALTQKERDHIANGFFREDAAIVLAEMKKKLEGEQNDR